MSKFFKGEKVIVIKNPDNQKRGKTRIGTIVSINEKPEVRVEVNTNNTADNIWNWGTGNSVKYLYNVQIMEEPEENAEYSNILYHLEEEDLVHYTEVAEALYC